MTVPIEIIADRPVLIAGPTASGKSALALHIARAQGGVIVNADALQVYDGWRILTARPGAADLVQAPHALYGHVPRDGAYSTGDWLREVTPCLLGDLRPIIVGGTGLNFTALTEGLTDIPAIAPAIRAQADALPLDALVAGLDTATKVGLDLANRARVQRAWEVLHMTGRGLRDWQDATPPPLLSLANATAIRIDAPRDWLTPRIAQRVDAMRTEGLLAEAEAMSAGFDAAHPSSKAIGAIDIVAHVRGEMDWNSTRDRIVVGTRQYAKRQRTWLAKRMRDWQGLDISSTHLSTAFQFTT